MAMDVQVKIEDHFKVVGSVADVTVGGDLHLLQERGRPLQLFGNLNVVGGELSAYRQNLKVRRGTVAFSGVPENPALDMRAERIITSENLTVGLELTGTLEDPVLEVYSDPVMPTTETLSYLIRGRGLDVNAGADGTAFALSMGASIVNESGLLQKFDKIPGVNSIELSADGSDDDTLATVSGYIGSRIYLAYGIGLYEPISVLTARLYLQTRLWAEVVSSLENSLDLYYSFDID
jgi:translocation and assembly module TamB